MEQAPARPLVAGGGSSGTPPRLAAALGRSPRGGEGFIPALLFLSAALSIPIPLWIVVVLVSESRLSFADPEVSIVEFLTGTKWQPHIGQFGILPLLTSTLMTSAIAMTVALALRVR